MAGIQTKFIAVLLFVVLVASYDPDVQRGFVDIVTDKGYPCEVHTVTTMDGFILTMFRIPHGNTEKRAPGGRPPVLLFHGLLDSSFTWILNMPNQSLSYILADNGYDVWFGNARGNRYSDTNIYFPQADPKFWNFSYDEFAQIDLPLIINYILNSTKYDKLYYVGHSQGTAQMFAALSDDSTHALSSKLRIFVGLGPVTTPAHQTNIYITVLTEILSQLDLAFQYLGVHEFLPPFSGIFKSITDIFCLEDPSACEGIIELICGKHQAIFNLSRMEVMVAHEPGGTSVKNMVHWGQMIKAGQFQKFDYGAAGNKIFYNQSTAPLYNIGNIDPKLPIALFYGLLDELADPTDVQNIITQLPVPPVYTREISSYSHLDFCWAIDANVQVYQDILSLLGKY